MEPDNRRENQAKFRRKVLNRGWFRLFLFWQIPSAFFAGIRVRALDEKHCVVSTPYGWRTRNPFRSIYFAVQAMAAEMATGVPGMMAIQGCTPPVSMLVTKLEAKFTKKAVSRVYFTCEDVGAIQQAVEKALASGEGVTVSCLSTGRMADGTIVSVFTVEWSFKAKNK